MIESAIVSRLDQLSSPVLLMAQNTGKRLTREEFSARLGIHRNTLAVRLLKSGFAVILSLYVAYVFS